jgi:hypothetical protein
MRGPMNEADFPEPSKELHDRILAETASAVRRKARSRRLVALCAVAGAYAIGVVTSGLFQAPAADVAPASRASIAASMETPRAAAANDLHEAEIAALQLQKASPAQRGEVLRRAGDRWLDEYGNIARATECYGRFLDTVPVEDAHRFDPQDTWLLRSLRCARVQENAHEDATI